MLILRKINFSPKEIQEMLVTLDDYIWIALDIKKGIIAAGDEFAGTLKYALLKQKCKIQDIFGIGFDLLSGDIDYISPINIKLMDRASTREVPKNKHERIEILVRYFFTELPVYKAERERPRYSKNVGED